MAGKRRCRDWQKTDPHMRDHPAFCDLVALLDTTPLMAHGLLAGLFGFAFKFAQDGDVSRFSTRQLAVAVGWTGNADAMVQALIDAGFMSMDMIIHDWHEWGGALFAERDKDAKRKWDERQNKPEQEDMSTDISGSPRMSRDEIGQCPREEKRREEESKKTTIAKAIAAPEAAAPTDPAENPCALVALPESIRSDGEVWPLVTKILGEDRVGALFNGRASPRSHAGTLRRGLSDICGYCAECMGSLSCEEREPLCRRIVLVSLARLAAADRPIKLVEYLYSHGNELADYCGEESVAIAREADKRAPLPELLERLGAALRAEPLAKGDDDE